jgi:hypothetical protein
VRRRARQLELMAAQRAATVPERPRNLRRFLTLYWLMRDSALNIDGGLREVTHEDAHFGPSRARIRRPKVAQGYQQL